MAKTPDENGGGGKVGEVEAMMGGGMDISHVITGARGEGKSKDETTKCDNEDK